ncbi:hypothetical protein [Nitrosomonas communis]|uniref:hypothetical protein n=1 Tax=Nitrosomonas communis TaxID=44574 RepID=UPI0026F08717|nr:hypothetical protein [Nitrosomonas communis]MCO6428160.1 hypothetical protein [Nitrosomonas communis]
MNQNEQYIAIVLAAERTSNDAVTRKTSSAPPCSFPKLSLISTKQTIDYWKNPI